MIGDAASAIGGPDIALTTLMGPGVDPHGYRATRSDIAALSKADLILWNGLYLEAQLETLMERLQRKTKVAAVGEAVPQDLRLSHSDYAGKPDPHVWMAPTLWTHAVDGVTQALVDAAPWAEADIRARAETYQSGVSQVSDYAAEVLSKVPEDQRVLVTAHDAFGYFGRAYGFEVLGIQGISTESEAGLNRIRHLVDTLVERKIGAVFVESSVSDRNIRALIEGAAAQGHEVVIGGELFSDAMGPMGTYESTYVGMIDHNVTTIARALGANVPESGMSGMLKGTAS